MEYSEFLEIDETARQKFEAARGGDSVLIDDFLPPHDSELFLGTLQELVLIDMEFGWREAAAKNQAGPLLESYLDQYPQLRQSTDLGELLTEEISLRKRFGISPEISEYKSRFPDIDLSATLFQQAESTPHPVEELKSQSRLGDYEIIREIGRGGMGVVYEAKQVVLGRHVALKVLPTGALKDPELIKRFEREARAAANLHHTNIVPVFGVGHDNGHHYYAMQFIPGEGLDQVWAELRRLEGIDGTQADQTTSDPHASIARSFAKTLLKDCSEEFSETVVPGNTTQAIPSTSQEIDVAHRDTGFSSLVQTSLNHRRWQKISRLGIQVADALDYAHRRGILHRDIKPANLLLDEKGTLWVTDFGLARIEHEENLTQTGDVMGTLRYMAPEVLQGTYDRRSDIFSLGMTLYELVSLRQGYGENERHRLIQQVSEGSIVPLRSINSRIPRDLETIILKCLDPELPGRYRSAGDLRDDLERFVNDEPIQARRVSAMEQLLRWARKNKGVAASLLAIFLLLAVVAVGASIAAAQLNTLAIEKGQETLRATNAKDLALKREQEAEEQRDRANQLAEDNRLQAYYSQMQLAAERIHTNSGYGDVRRILKNWIPSNPQERDLRGWEWYLLEGKCHGEEAILGDPGMVCTAVHWSDDGASIYATDKNMFLVEFDAHSYEEKDRIYVGEWYPSAIWNPQKNRVAVSLVSGVRILEWPTGKVLQEFAEGLQASRLDWNHDGTLLCFTERHGPGLWVVEADTGREVFRTQVTKYSFNAFHPANNVLFHCSDQYELVNVETRESLLRFTLDNQQGCTSAAWSSDGNVLAIADGPYLAIVNSATGELISKSEFPSITSMTWRNHFQLLLGCTDGTSHIVNTRSGAIVRSYRGYQNRVNAVDSSPDGEFVLTGGESDPATVWRYNNPAEDFAVAASVQNSVAWSPDSDTMCALTGEADLTFWNVSQRKSSGDVIIPEQSPSDVLVNVVWSPDGQQIVCLGRDGTLYVVNAKSLEVELTLPSDSKPLLRSELTRDNMDWSVDGTSLAAITGERQVTVWDRRTWGRVRVIDDVIDIALSVRIHPDGERVSVSSIGGLTIYDPNSQTTQSIRTNGWPFSHIWTPDGCEILTHAPDHKNVFAVTAYDVDSLSPKYLFEGATRKACTFAWNPDGTRLAVGCEDGSVCLWETQTQTLVARFHDFQYRCNGLRWSPDGTRLACSSAGAVRIYDARRGMERAR